MGVFWCSPDIAKLERNLNQLEFKIALSDRWQSASSDCITNTRGNEEPGMAESQSLI